MPRKRKVPSFAELAAHLPGKLRPPFGIVLGAPGEVTDLALALPGRAVVCYQMDLFQAARLKQELRALGTEAEVHTAADLWDLPAPVQTLLYPVALGGERALKLDMIEQAYHALVPHGTFVVLSPYERDEFFPQALKKVFGKVHSPMGTGNAVFWCQRDGDRARRRHEVVFQVRVDEATSYRFVSRPGVFSYGRFDEGARALVETMEVNEGDRVLDIGCGIGTNGILAARRSGPAGFTAFADSNVRAIALADLNARTLGVASFETIASATLRERELPRGSFDVVLANPPYYAQLSIAQLFIERGRSALKRGGRFFLVTKQPEGVYPLIAQAFGEPETVERRGYIVFRCQAAG
jgi:16S rRNA (guanine1207-N2)-methyltransferase